MANRNSYRTACSGDKDEFYGKANNPLPQPARIAILAMVRQELRKQRRITEYNELWEQVQKGDYENAIRLIREKVNLIDDDGIY